MNTWQQAGVEKVEGRKTVLSFPRHSHSRPWRTFPTNPRLGRHGQRPGWGTHSDLTNATSAWRAKLIYSSLSSRACASASERGSAPAELGSLKRVTERVGTQVQHDSISHGTLGCAPWVGGESQRIEVQEEDSAGSGLVGDHSFIHWLIHSCIHSASTSKLNVLSCPLVPQA